MVSSAVAIFIFFQTKALISYSLFLSRDAGEDEALVLALNMEARTSTAAVLSCWGADREYQAQGLSGLRSPWTEGAQQSFGSSTWSTAG